jgi:hypothetical protein
MNETPQPRRIAYKQLKDNFIFRNFDHDYHLWLSYYPVADAGRNQVSRITFCHDYLPTAHEVTLSPTRTKLYFMAAQRALEKIY